VGGALQQRGFRCRGWGWRLVAARTGAGKPEEVLEDRRGVCKRVQRSPREALPAIRPGGGGDPGLWEGVRLRRRLGDTPHQQPRLKRRQDRRDLEPRRLDVGGRGWRIHLCHRAHGGGRRWDRKRNLPEDDGVVSRGWRPHPPPSRWKARCPDRHPVRDLRPGS